MVREIGGIGEMREGDEFFHEISSRWGTEKQVIAYARGQ